MSQFIIIIPERISRQEEAQYVTITMNISQVGFKSCFWVCILNVEICFFNVQIFKILFNDNNRTIQPIIRVRIERP